MNIRDLLFVPMRLLNFLHKTKKDANHLVIRILFCFAERGSFS